MKEEMVFIKPDIEAINRRYTDDEKRIDLNQGMYDAEERGAERGRKEGHKEGLREGRQEERKENIKSMMKYLPIEQVAKIMKITVTEVQTIINS